MKPKNNRFHLFPAAAFATVVLASFASQSAQAASGTWTGVIDGDWGVDANWNGASFPNGATQAANFNGNAAIADTTVTTTLDGSYTVGTMNKLAVTGGTATNWTITSPTNTLTFNNNTNNSTVGNSFNGNTTFTLDTDISLTSNLVLNGNGNNSAKVRLGATVGGHTISGAGNITINNTNTNGAGVITINSNINTTGTISNTSTQGQNNHTIAGIIGSGVTGVTQNSSKTLVLSGSNTYTSPTTVSLGSLVAGVASVPNVSGAFGNNSAVTIADAAATSIILNFNTQIGSLAGGGAVGGAVSLNTSTLTTGGDNTTTSFGGVISGGSTSGLTKVGNGTFTLTGINTFTGAINVGAGTLVAGRAGNADISTTSAVNLNGGNLVFQPGTGFAKTYNGGINVNNAGILSYDNTSATTYTLTLGGAALALNANLTVKNTSDVETLVNGINISRVISGPGNLIVDTYNNIDDSGDNFSLGRVLLSGNNSTWNSNLEIARGTVSLSGDAALVDTLGTSTITIGSTGSSSGAGLTFFPTGTAVTVSYDNNIIVNTGASPNGFRAIKGSGSTNHRITFTGTVTLNGDLTLDHSFGSPDNRITLDGVVSGDGGLTVTRAGGSSTETTVVMTKANTYTGPTVIKPTASLAVSGTSSLDSNITVESTGRLGGGGGTSGTLTLNDGANFFFFYSPTYVPFDVGGTVTVANSFGVASIRGGSRGEPVPWNTVPADTYTLIGTTSSTFNTGGLTNNITNFGVANAATGLPGGRTAYFKNGGGSGGGGLQMVVNSGYAAWQIANGNTAGTLDDDHDNDGVDNGTEFFLSGSTNSTGFTPLPGVVDTGGVLTVTWVKGATYAGAYTTDFVVEISDTLDNGSWTPAPEGVGAGNVEITGNNVKYTFPTTGPKKFARLKVTGP